MSDESGNTQTTLATTTPAPTTQATTTPATQYDSMEIHKYLVQIYTSINNIINELNNYKTNNDVLKEIYNSWEKIKQNKSDVIKYIEIIYNNDTSKIETITKEFEKHTSKIDKLFILNSDPQTNVDTVEQPANKEMFIFQMQASLIILVTQISLLSRQNVISNFSNIQSETSGTINKVIQSLDSMDNKIVESQINNNIDSFKQLINSINKKILGDTTTQTLIDKTVELKTELENLSVSLNNLPTTTASAMSTELEKIKKSYDAISEKVNETPGLLLTPDQTESINKQIEDLQNKLKSLTGTNNNLNETVQEQREILDKLKKLKQNVSEATKSVTMQLPKISKVDTRNYYKDTAIINAEKILDSIKKILNDFEIPIQQGGGGNYENIDQIKKLDNIKYTPEEIVDFINDYITKIDFYKKEIKEIKESLDSSRNKNDRAEYRDEMYHYELFNYILTRKILDCVKSIIIKSINTIHDDSKTKEIRKNEIHNIQMLLITTGSILSIIGNKPYNFAPQILMQYYEFFINKNLEHSNADIVIINKMNNIEDEITNYKKKINDKINEIKTNIQKNKNLSNINYSVHNNNNIYCDDNDYCKDTKTKSIKTSKTVTPGQKRDIKTTSSSSKSSKKNLKGQKQKQSADKTIKKPAQEPVADEPAQEPVADEPVADEPVADEPVADESIQLAEEQSQGTYDLGQDDPVQDDPVLDEGEDEPEPEPVVGQQTSIDKLKKIINDLYKHSKFFQNDVILKLLCIISNTDKNSNELSDLKTKVEEPIENINDSYDNITSLLNQNSLFSHMLSLLFVNTTDTFIYDDYEKYINRDTNILKRHFNNITDADNKYILLFKLIEILKDYVSDDTKRLFMNTDTKVNDFVILFSYYINNYYLLLDKFNNIYNKYSIINNIYNNIINNKKKVFTCVKYRADKKMKGINISEYNPRYDLKIGNEGITKNMLFMNYYNFDNNISVIDETKEIKNVDIKKYNTRFNNKETYIFGPYDYIFDESKTNAKIAEDIINDKNSYINKTILAEEPKDLCIIGYGQSGSGKTSSLIYLKKDNEEFDGIIIEICKNNKFVEKYGKIDLFGANIYINYNTTEYPPKKDEERNAIHKIENLVQKYVPQKEKLSFTYENINSDLNWYNKEIEKIIDGSVNKINIKIGKIITEMFNMREIEPTPNNENSSRSHVVLCLQTYIKNTETTNTETTNTETINTETTNTETTNTETTNTETINTEIKGPKIFICDFAGVENVFDCDKLSELLNFNEKYNKSDKYAPNKQNLIKIDDVTDSDIIKSRLFISANNNWQTIKPLYKKSEMTLQLDKYVCNETHIDFNKKKNINYIEEYNEILNKEKEIYDIINRHIEINDYLYDRDKTYNNNMCLGKRDPNFSIYFNIFNIPNKKDNPDALFCREDLRIDINKSRNHFFIGNSNKFDNDIESIYLNNIINSNLSFDEFKENHKGLLELLSICSNILYNNNFKNKEDYNKSILQKNGLVLPLPKNTEDTNIKTLYDYIPESSFSNNISLDIDLETYEEQFINKFNYLFSSTGKLKIYSSASDTINQFNLLLYEKTLTVSSLEEFQNAIKDDFEILLQVACNYIRVCKLYYNCKLRKNEGTMINYSLEKIKEDISGILVNNTLINDTNGPFFPIFHENNIFPYCINSIIPISSENIFEKFYNFQQTKQTSINKLLACILSFYNDDPFNNTNVDINNLKNLYFNIFTVINLTKNDKTNNPPNPPYINLNNLIFDNKTKNKEQFETSLNRFKGKLNNYSFYRKVSTEIQNKLYDDLIKYIRSNNSATLIGSLEATDSLQNIIFNKIYDSCYYNKNIPKSINNLKKKLKKEDDVILNNTDSLQKPNEFIDNKYKDKYLKYKSKYLSLKEEMIKSKLL